MCEHTMWYYYDIIIIIIMIRYDKIIISKLDPTYDMYTWQLMS